MPLTTNLPKFLHVVIVPSGTLFDVRLSISHTRISGKDMMALAARYAPDLNMVTQWEGLNRHDAIAVADLLEEAIAKDPLHPHK